MDRYILDCEEERGPTEAGGSEGERFMIGRTQDGYGYIVQVG